MDGFQLNEVPIQHPQPVVHGQKGSQTTLNPLGISCDNCRIWKTKCDRGQQECVRCRKKGVSCTYSGIKKKPKVMNQIIQSLDGIKSRIDQIDHTLSLIQKKLDNPQPQSLSTDQDALDATFITKSTNPSNSTSLTYQSLSSTRPLRNTDPFRGYIKSAGLLHDENTSDSQRTLTNYTSMSENVLSMPGSRTCAYFNASDTTGANGSLGVEYEAPESTNSHSQGLNYTTYDFGQNPSANGSSSIYSSVV